jgi:hypothetical protein
MGKSSELWRFMYLCWVLTSIQPLPPYSQIRQDAIHERIETTAMIMLYEMAKLMDDYIING